MASFLGISFYVSMVIAAYCCQWLLPALGLEPYRQTEAVVTHGAVYYYTTVLNILALILTAFLFKRFWQNGGKEILNKMAGHEAEKHSCH